MPPSPPPHDPERSSPSFEALSNAAPTARGDGDGDGGGTGPPQEGVDARDGGSGHGRPSQEGGRDFAPTANGDKSSVKPPDSSGGGDDGGVGDGAGGGDGGNDGGGVDRKKARTEDGKQNLRIEEVLH